MNEMHPLLKGSAPMPPESVRERFAEAWEHFTRSEAARSASGAGLGLAIVKAIVEAHGGSVEFAPHSEGGADVVLTLPGSARSTAAASPRAAWTTRGRKGRAITSRPL